MRRKNKKKHQNKKRGKTKNGAEGRNSQHTEFNGSCEKLIAYWGGGKISIYIKGDSIDQMNRSARIK